MNGRAIFRMSVALLGLIVAGHAQAQSVGADQQVEEPQPQQLPPLRPTLPGRVAESAVGEIGQRRTREAAEAEGIARPTGRIASRVQNRIQSRLRNRIDRNYDPRANSTSPFAVAEAETRGTGGTRRR